MTLRKTGKEVRFANTQRGTGEPRKVTKGEAKEEEGAQREVKRGT